jgi:hypothetical protein
MPKPVQSRPAPPPKAKPVRSRQQPVSRSKANPVASRQQPGPPPLPVNNTGRGRQGFSGLQRPGQARPTGGFVPGGIGQPVPNSGRPSSMFQSVGPNGVTQHMAGRPGSGGMFQQVGPNGITQNMGGGRGQRGMSQSIGPDGTIYQHMNGMTQVVRPGSGGGQRPQAFHPPQHFGPPQGLPSQGIPQVMPGGQTHEPPLHSGGTSGAQPGQLPFPRMMPGRPDVPTLPALPQVPDPNAGMGTPGGLPQLPAHALEDNKPFVAPTGNSPVSLDLSGRRGVTGNGVLPNGSQLRLGDPASLVNNPGLRIDGGGANSSLVLPQSFNDYASLQPDQAQHPGWNVLAPRALNGTNLTAEQQLQQGLWYRNFPNIHQLPERK